MLCRLANSSCLAGWSVPPFTLALAMMLTLMLTMTFAVLRVAKGEEPGQPGAGDMRELVWDEELEAIAQR